MPLKRMLMSLWKCARSVGASVVVAFGTVLFDGCTKVCGPNMMGSYAKSQLSPPPDWEQSLPSFHQSSVS
jgi:hypothetical protein